MKKNSVRMLCEAALLIAAAQILSMIKLWEMPWGGSVVLAMVPIVLFAVRWGLKEGLIASFAFGCLQFLFDGGFAIGWQSILGDYVVALTALGLAGVGHKKGMGGVIVGSVVGCLGRFISLWATGALLWGEYMYDIYGLPMTNEWVYSFLYNLPALVSGVLTVIICVVLYNIRPLRKYILGGDIQG